MQKWLEGGVAHLVDHLPGKHEALSSTKKEEEQKEKEKKASHNLAQICNVQMQNHFSSQVTSLQIGLWPSPAAPPCLRTH
jgi:hypothetical protein